MAIPDYQTIMLPLLKLAGDKQEHSLSQAIDTLASQFNLTDKERRELLPSGHKALFDNRVGWARTYIKKAGLIELTGRGYFRITTRGLTVLNKDLKRIDVKFLLQFEEFREFKTFRRGKVIRGRNVEDDEEKTPSEALESAYQSIRNSLATDLLQQIKASSPSLFENIVIDLLVEMRYGGSRKDAGEAIGKTGDEGIDGIIMVSLRKTH
jgi:restriction system protein